MEETLRLDFGCSLGMLDLIDLILGKDLSSASDHIHSQTLIEQFFVILVESSILTVYFCDSWLT